jgi:hypothetical protein
MGGFAWSIPGGFDKPYYLRFRELRKKYGLSDKQLVECLIWFALNLKDSCDADVLGTGNTWPEIVTQYLTTAPSEMPRLPEVI